MIQCQELVRTEFAYKTRPCTRPAKWQVTIKRVFTWRYRCNRCFQRNQREGVVESAVAL